MPRPRKPARLWYESGRDTWCILDAGKKHRLEGCRLGDRSEAESRFAAYIVERDAEAARVAAEAAQTPAVMRRNPDNKNPEKVLIADCIALYCKTKEGTKNAGLTGIHAVHLLGYWGDMYLIDIDEDTCLGYAVARTSTLFRSKGSKGEGRFLSPQTARRELETLSAALGVWHKKFTLSALPIVTKPPKGSAHPDWLTVEEYARLLRAIRGERWVATDLATREPIWESWVTETLQPQEHLERFTEIGYATGTRAGAMLRLGWKPARLNGYIDFSATTLHRAGADEEVTRKRQPACRIPDSLVPKLRAWREADQAEARRLALQAPPVEMVDRIVRYENEEVERIGQSFETAVRRACLDRREIDGALRVGNANPKHDMGWPTPHILRHTRATLLLQARQSPHDVGRFLGMSTKMVEDVYGHHHPDHQKELAKVA
jgi:integrase